MGETEGQQEGQLTEGSAVAQMAEGGQPPASNEFLDTIPEAYRDKPYMSNIKSNEDLFKQFDNAQSLIGAPRVPKSEAPKEDWDKFYNSLGRPEKPEGYSLFNDGDSEQVKEINTKMQSAFHEAGLTKQQAEKVIGEYQGVVKGITESSQMNQEEYNKQFNEELEKVFGEDKEGALKVSENLFNKYASDSVKLEVSKLEPQSQAALAAVLKGISDEYINSDDITKIKTGQGATPSRTATEIRSEIREVMGSKEYNNVFNQEGQKDAQSRLESLSKELLAVQSLDKQKQ